MTRQEANIIIAKKLLEICKNPEYKDLRFGQILANLNIQTYKDINGILKPNDIFNDESTEILLRLIGKQYK